MVKGRVLVIAGSDCSGGAGLEADQKVIAAHGCYAMTATTATTAQNTKGVYGIHDVPPAFVAQQVDACLEDVGVDVIKTGMLASPETIAAVADALERNAFSGPLVVDPVVVATAGGARLLPAAGLRELRDRMLPRATVVTPNVPEALLLLRNSEGEGGDHDDDRGVPAPRGVEDLENLARALRLRGPKWVLVKGGHLPLRRADLAAASSEADKEVVVDVLCGPGGECLRFETGYLTSRNTHGTGCSLASAIACHLAMGEPVPDAVRAACRYVEAGIRTAPGLGKGNGPLNHFHSTYTLPFSPGHFLEWLLERPDVAPVWHRYVHHPFVMAVGDGTLPVESFKGYLIQDYLYLTHFARASSLAGYKANNIPDISAAAFIVATIDRETALHVGYCSSFGVSREEMERSEEKQACTAYTRYILDIGLSQDWLALQFAMAPCLLGYGAVAKMLHRDPRSVRQGNRYWAWVENYVSEDFVKSVRTGEELLETKAVLQSPSRIEELVRTFIHATKMEIGFWEMFPTG